MTSAQPAQLLSVANSLQEATQALLALSRADQSASSTEDDQPVRMDLGEIRSYYFPAPALSQEKELLRQYRADDFQGLLNEAQAMMTGLAQLLQSFNKNVRLKGHVVASLGLQVDHVCGILVRMEEVYRDVKPVRN